MNKILRLICCMLLTTIVLVSGCKSKKTELNKYNVVFKDYDGSVLKEEIVEEGKNAIAPVNPTRDGYTFTGWDKEYSNINKDIIINALYEQIKIINKYTVIFKDYNGTVLKEEIVEEGKNATAPDVSSREGYNFIGWNKEFTNITGDIVINATYEKIKLTVTFLDDEGNLLKEETVLYGEDAIGLKPEKKGYLTFMGWDKTLFEIKENTTIKAIYGPTVHKVTFYDGNEKLDLGLDSYTEGEEVALPIYNKEGYQFDGWYLSDKSMTEYQIIDKDNTTNLMFYAKCTPLSNLNPITLPSSTYKFETINKNLHSSGTMYVYQPKFPIGPATSVTLYDWSTSDSNIATVSAYSSITGKAFGYCVLTATLKSDPSIKVNCIIKVTNDGIFISSEEEANKYEFVTVTFKGKNEEIIKTMKCLKGGEVIYPTPLQYEGYKFVGWDKQNYDIQENTVITAQYELGVNNYAGKSFSIIGDSISTYSGYVPDGFSCFYPYPTADVTNVNKTWWMQVINKVGGTLFSNNSYSGTCVGDASKYATKYKSRLTHTLINSVAPDVILIYMGSNDCASKYVSYDAFNEGYRQMLNNLKELCPNSEIILCTLAKSPFYDDDERIKFNGAIVKYGEEFDLKVLDLSNADLSGKLVDSAHPNTLGMSELASEIIEELTK